MLFEMNRGIEEDLGCLVLKENLDFLLEDQRYGLLCSLSACGKVDLWLGL